MEWVPTVSRYANPRFWTCYRFADKSLTRLTSRCILFDGENISFDASLVIYISSTNTYSSNYDYK